MARARFLIILAGALFMAGLCVSSAMAVSEQVLYSFAGGSDGAQPTSNLIADKAGNLYGTTAEGGPSSSCGAFGGLSCGVVFELTPSDSGWAEHVLYSFTGGADGGTPYGGLVIDANGNLYGTTNAGGASGQGTVFELTPNGDNTWTETVIHSFAGGSDGAAPRAGLILKGNELTGTTSLGGSSTSCGFFGGEPCGTVFGMVHTSQGWTEEVLYTFQGGADGGIPYGGLALDSVGNLYGTTTQYGAGFGTVYELSRVENTWKETTLYTFSGGNDGSYSESTLILDPSGNLYGTTSARGGSQVGTVFQLAKDQGGFTLNTLHTFTGNGDGAVPEAGLVRQGNSVFGTTYDGGTYSLCGLFGDSPCGTVYELTRGKQGVTYSVVYSFMGAPDATQPQGSLWVDASGNLYGTGSTGGANGQGAVFEITSNNSASRLLLTARTPQIEKGTGSW